MSIMRYGLIILTLYLLSTLVAGTIGCNDSDDSRGKQELTPMLTPSKIPASDGEVVLGDVNLDGRVDMGDVSKVERIIMEADPPAKYADLNGDGVVDMRDVTIIERIILEML